jgi:hypothetical protein
MKCQISQTHTGIYLAVGEKSLHQKILSYLFTSIWTKPVAPDYDWITRQTIYLRRNTVASSSEADTSSVTLNSLILYYSKRWLSWPFNVSGKNKIYLGLHMFAGFWRSLDFVGMFSIKILLWNFKKIRPVGAALTQIRTERRDLTKVNSSFSRLCKRVYNSSLYFRKEYNFGTEMTAFFSCYIFGCVTFIPVWS